MFRQRAIPRLIFRLVCLGSICLFGSIPAFAQVLYPPRYPAENPPAIKITDSSKSSSTTPSNPISGAPTTEWIFHKTGDSAHPNGQEQQVLWLMNRARSNPHAEGVWLATSTDPDIAGGRDWFSVNKTMLQAAFDSYAAKPPAAFDVRLYNAAKAHSDYMISIDTQTHDGQMNRITAAGFTCGGGSGWSMRGSIFAYADNSLNAHAAWNIDWGGSNGGMQEPPGHRYAVMSYDGDYTNFGVALVYENNPSTDIGPYVTTGNYCHAGSASNHYNQFIVGTVWRDADHDGMYDPSEGLGGVTVTPNTGTYYAITANSGGYAIPVTGTPGSYTSVSFAGSGINDSKSVTIGSLSVLLDYLYAPEFTEFVYVPVIRK